MTCSFTKKSFATTKEGRTVSPTKQFHVYKTDWDEEDEVGRRGHKAEKIPT